MAFRKAPQGTGTWTGKYQFLQPRLHLVVRVLSVRDRIIGAVRQTGMLHREQSKSSQYPPGAASTTAAIHVSRNHAPDLGHMSTAAICENYYLWTLSKRIQTCTLSSPIQI